MYDHSSTKRFPTTNENEILLQYLNTYTKYYFRNIYDFTCRNCHYYYLSVIFNNIIYYGFRNITHLTRTKNNIKNSTQIMLYSLTHGKLARPL